MSKYTTQKPLFKIIPCIQYKHTGSKKLSNGFMNCFSYFFVCLSFFWQLFVYFKANFGLLTSMRRHLTHSIFTNFLALLNLRLRLEGNPNPLNLKVFCRFFIFWKSYYLFYIVSVKTRKLSHFNANLEWRVFKLIFRIFFLISLFFCKTIKPHKLYKKTFK